MKELSLNEAQRWITSLKNPGPRGWNPEHKKFGKYFRDGFKKRAKKHVDIYGIPWKAGYHRPYAKVGEEAFMDIETSRGLLITKFQRVRTMSGKRAAKKYQQRVGVPNKPNRKPLIKTTGKHKKKQIWDFLKTAGRSTRTSKKSFSYGYTNGTRWIEKLQNGGTYDGTVVPARTILGLTQKDILFVEKTYADGYEKRRLKGLR